MRYARRLIVGLFTLVVALSVVFGAAMQPDSPGPRGGTTAGSAGGSGHRLPGFLQAARGLVGGAHRPAAESSVTVSMARHDVLPAQVSAPAGHRVRELVGKRTANARFYQLSNGRTQAEISATPVNYRTASGGYAPIDTTVRPSTRGGYAYANTTNTFTTRFGTSTAALLRVQWGGRWVQLGLAGPDRAVTPRVSGSTVVYPGVAGGADLEYQVTSTALKETITLTGAPAAAPSYAFTVRTGGLRASAGRDGSVRFDSPGGQPVFTMPAPYMYDSGPDPKSPLHHPYSTHVAQVLDRSGTTATRIRRPD